ncbi:peptidoglycan-binding protein [Thermopolyspora sp. NPDC052614]|uniref:peptidoglycan-binding protein n=1 Tax=Thermopolyspora sp. NPDC052614 TaxID=3155682 RepID=UPI0034379D37
MRPARRLLSGVAVAVLVIAGVAWAVGARLRSPADEAAARRPPAPSLVTAAVTREKLTSTVAVSGRLEYGSPVPVVLAGAVGGADGGGSGGGSGGGVLGAAAGGGQRVTRAPRTGRLTEGTALMEVDGRPVFALKGTVPMYRTITPGARGADVRQLQRALRRLGFGGRVSGVFDRATADAVRRWYAKKGYRAQEPSLGERQTLAELRRAVRTARETLRADRKAAKEAGDLSVLKARLANARADLRDAERNLAAAESRTMSPEDAARREELRRAVQTAREDLHTARQALAQAGAATAVTATSPTGSVTTRPTPGPAPQPTPSATPPATPPGGDLTQLRAAVLAAERNLVSAEAALAAFEEQATAAHAKRLQELRKTTRTAKEAVLTAEQALRQARDPGALRLKVSNGEKNLASAREILAEYERGYGLSVPPGEIVFLPDLPARLDKVEVRAGETVQGRVGVVTSASFMVTGSVDIQEAGLIRAGMPATIVVDDDRSFPAVLTAVGADARSAATTTEDSAGPDAGPDAGADTEREGPDLSSEPVLLTPASSKGLRPLVGAAVTARIAVGATGGKVLTVPVAAVVTSADGKPRVRVEYAPDRTRDVEVRTGLTADGKVQVTPVSPGTLKEGDRVVLGNA